MNLTSRIRKWFDEHNLIKLTTMAIGTSTATVIPEVEAAKLFFDGNQPKVESKYEAPKQDELNVKVTTEFKSKYLLRGLELTDDPVTQIVPELNYGPLTAIGFFNIETTGPNAGNPTESDLTLDYTTEFHKALLSVGAAYLTYPNTGLPATKEVYIKAELPEQDFNLLFTPRFSVVQDIGTIGGTYFRIDAIKEFATKNQPVELSIFYGLNKDHMIPGKNAGHAGILGTLPIKLTDNLSLGITGELSFPTDNNGLKREFVGGIALTYQK